jgi:hypothetical protein
MHGTSYITLPLSQPFPLAQTTASSPRDDNYGIDEEDNEIEYYDGGN